MGQDKLKIDEKGAKAEAAAAIVVISGSIGGLNPSHYVTMDCPFLFWVEKENVPVPVFSAYITEEHWERKV